jgi:pimeloyl-ACP methyl ester carboxylesterase
VVEPISPPDDLAGGSTPPEQFSWSGAGPYAGTETELRKPSPEPDGYAWYPDILEPWDVVVEEFYLTGTNGKKIFVDVHRPVWASGEMPCHALVLVPGGMMQGSAWHAPWRRCSSKHWAAAGFVVCDFDFEGRGKSEGEEDMYGPVHREDLKTVIEYVASRLDVIPGKVGLVSSSWGCTIASTTLGVYPDLPVRFYVDFEGAQNRYVATQFDDPKWIEIWGGHPTSDDDFWDPREAITFQPYVKVPYIRLQGDIDHALKVFYFDHAFQMVDAAVNGASPYARLNHNPPNAILKPEDAGTCQWEKMDETDDRLYLYVVEASMTKFPGE